MTQMVNPVIAIPSLVREDDLLAHIEDSREFWIPRDGRPTKRAWSELTAAERIQVQEAERRAAYVVLFTPNGF